MNREDFLKLSNDEQDMILASIPFEYKHCLNGNYKGGITGMAARYYLDKYDLGSVLAEFNESEHTKTIRYKVTFLGFYDFGEIHFDEINQVAKKLQMPPQETIYWMIKNHREALIKKFNESDERLTEYLKRTKQID